MRIRWPVARALAFAALAPVAPLSARAQRPAAHPRRDTPLLRSIEREHPCRRGVRVETLGDSIPAACTLAAASVDAVASGRARRLGVPPADTLRITRAVVTSMTFTDPASGRLADAYWSVVLVLSNHDFGVGARIDQETGTITLGRTELPAPRASGRRAP